MSLKGQGHAAKRDTNDLELRKAAEQMGWWMIEAQEPCDYWGALRARPELGFIPIEIKYELNPLTHTEEKFHLECKRLRLKQLIWNTVDDVTYTTNRLRGGTPP
jgi:hypothetical protein